MASDANLVLAPLTTSTTAAAQTSLDLKTSPAWLRRVNAELVVSTYTAATAGAVFTPGLQQSADNTTFLSLGDFGALTCATAATNFSGIYNLPVSPTLRYLRFNMACSVGTGTVSIVYQCRIQPSA